MLEREKMPSLSEVFTEGSRAEAKVSSNSIALLRATMRYD